MIKGLESFTGYFKDYKEQYLLIGGSACDIWFTDQGLTFRVTKDLKNDGILDVIQRVPDLSSYIQGIVDNPDYTLTS